MEITAHNRTIEVRGLPITESNRLRLQNTLRAIPAIHIRSLTYINIRDRQNSDGSEYAGGSTNATVRNVFRLPPGERRFWIMIDIDSFDPRQREINNRENGLHYTLLHEIGHVVDWSFGAFRWIRRHDVVGYREIRRRVHRGSITTGDQEKFADVYADFFFYTESERPMDRAMEAVLGSPAFDSLRDRPLRRP